MHLRIFTIMEAASGAKTHGSGVVGGGGGGQFYRQVLAKYARGEGHYSSYASKGEIHQSLSEKQTINTVPIKYP